MKISLLGYMGSGKSSLAKLLAAHLELPLLDLDHLIEEECGQSVSELIFNRGELFFRQKEREILLDILQKPDFVLALGGGTPCYYDNMDQVNRSSISIYLERSIQDLYDVLAKDRRERPLIAHLADQDLKEFIAKHLFERREFYEKAIFKISQKQKDEEERLHSILNYLK
ncbi:shikimate kinase [Croceimicrobium hydrocarbonivorans]|uniref:Shikimate kinase n=1 Tax=Croceimicrobium hydrocarbonivorans TaxID=2761580 RepID=A0A7H0VEC4_9FLAO|nr:shikimate kinase [Croceimicrobium hydrocarbonivorans]QNR24072.1 shikimate kinase [Croceimicrobium hydrocarbonivorans]